MALNNPYCSEQDVRDQLGDAGNKLAASLIQRAVNASSRAVDHYCGPLRRFWRDATATTRVYRAQDAATVITDDFSTRTGLVVKSDDDGDGVYETTWTEGTDFQCEPLNADVVAAGDTPEPFAFWRLTAVGMRRWPMFGTPRAGVQVTARFGWSAIPDDVTEAALLKAVGLFRRKDAPFGVAGFGELGVVRISRQDSDVVALLANYVKTIPATLTYDTQRGSLFHGRQLWTPWP